MIQLKPGLQPATFVKNRKSLSARPRSRRKKNRGLRFERVFSDSAVTPVMGCNGTTGAQVSDMVQERPSNTQVGHLRSHTDVKGSTALCICQG